jgi:hypothetical protein
VTVTVNSALPDTQPPSTPSLISAVAKAANEVALTWTAVTDNVRVNGYQIIRNGAPLASVSGTTQSYSDRTVSANTTYYYSVRAVDAAGNYSGLSNSAQVTTPASSASGTCPAAVTGAFTGCYYNNVTLEGSPAFVRTDREIGFDWGAASPHTSVSPGRFSVRWQGYFNFDAATYAFDATASDGIRIYIDGVPILDRWRDQPAYMYSIRRSLSAGSHLIVVEYYESTGSSTAHLSWRKI